MSLEISVTDRFPAMKYRDFQKLFVSNAITNVGFWLTTIALYSLFIFRTDIGAIQIGTLAFVGVAPRVLAGPLAGVVVDRFDRRTVIYASELLSGALVSVVYLFPSFLLTYLVYFLVGLLTAAADPAHEAILPQIVPDDELTQANGLMATSESIAQILGPALAGGLLTLVSAETLLLIDIATYGISAVIVVTVSRYTVNTEDESMLENLKAGVRTIVDSRRLLGLSGTGVVLFATIAPFEALITLYIRDVLSTGPSVYGTAVGLTAAGAFVAGIMTNAYGKSIDERSMIPYALLVTGSAMFGHVVFRSPASLFALSFVMGLGTATSAILMTTLIQQSCEERLHGRVLATFSSSTEGAQSAFMVVAALAASSVGVLAVFSGAGIILVACGVAYSITSATLVPVGNSAANS